jgi:hypothetical protein
MRNIINITPNPADFTILVEFENSIKKYDCKPLLNLPAFLPLNDKYIFKKVINKGYFIEWTQEEIDLSADTLWHDGI